MPKAYVAHAEDRPDSTPASLPSRYDDDGEGLLMYLEPADGHDLIADCAARFPGGQMVFAPISHRASQSVTLLEFG